MKQRELIQVSFESKENVKQTSCQREPLNTSSNFLAKHTNFPFFLNKVVIRRFTRNVDIQIMLLAGLQTESREIKLLWDLNRFLI